MDEGVSHSVTPLWCAAVSGRLAVVKVLLRWGLRSSHLVCGSSLYSMIVIQSTSSRFTMILLRHGADVNAVSDSGSTPVRSACYIVRPGENTG